AVLLVGDDGDPGHLAGAIGVDELLLEGDAEVLARRRKAELVAAGRLDDCFLIGAGDLRGGRRGIAATVLPGDVDREYHAEHRNREASSTLPARHQCLRSPSL